MRFVSKFLLRHTVCFLLLELLQYWFSFWTSFHLGIYHPELYSRKESIMLSSQFNQFSKNNIFKSEASRFSACARPKALQKRYVISITMHVISLIELSWNRNQKWRVILFFQISSLWSGRKIVLHFQSETFVVKFLRSSVEGAKAREIGLRQSTRPLHFFVSPRVDLLIFVMTATRTISILPVMTIVAGKAKQLPRTRSKRDCWDWWSVFGYVEKWRGRAAPM